MSCITCHASPSIKVYAPGKIAYGCTPFKVVDCKGDLKVGDCYCYECFKSKGYKTSECKECICISCGELFKVWEYYNFQGEGCSVLLHSDGKTLLGNYSSKYDLKEFKIIGNVEFKFLEKGKYVCDRCVESMLSKKIIIES